MATEEACCDAKFWIYIAIIVLLVLFAGMMSGLTLGLMSLSLMDLEVLSKSGTPQDRKHAAKIMPVVKNQHLLLCTLLICNALAMEALPIFLDSLVTAWGAVLISVTLILMFGEIIPQSVCSRYGLAVGAAMAPMVRVLVWICFPVAWPISKLLDFLLGEGHVALFHRAELKTLVDLHGNEAGKGGELTHDETTIIAGALGLSEKTAEVAMTPISETFAIDVNAKLDSDLMNLILENGHSRVPVYYEQPTNIIGLVLVKNLLSIHPTDEVPIKNVTIRKIPRLDTSRLNDLVYVYYNLRLWVKQLEIKIDAKAISLDEIDTTAAWRGEVEEPVIETALDWLEDSGDDHGISEDLDQDVSEDIQFHAESASVPPAERESQSEGDRPSGSTSSRPPLPVPSSRGHLFRGSSTSSRGCLTPVRGAHASRAPTPTARGKAVSTAITFARKKSRGNP